MSRWRPQGGASGALLSRLRRAGAEPKAPRPPPGPVDLAFAALAVEMWRERPAAVASALAERGLEVFERREDHHYVPRYFGGLKPQLRRLPMEDEEFRSLADEVLSHKTTMLYYDRLYTLFQGLRHTLAAAPADGTLEVLEVGVRKGGASWFLGALGERLAPGRTRLTAVDTFGGHSLEDLRGGNDGQHRRGKFRVDPAVVVEYLSRFEADIVKARIQDAAAQLEDKRFSFVHLDVDLYEPTRFTLEFLQDRLTPGAVVVIDDYGKESCPGIASAVDEFVAGRERRWFALELQTAQCVLIQRT